MPAPTFVASYPAADYGDPTSPKTSSVTTQAGDRVVIFASQKSEIGTISVDQANGITLTSFNSYYPAFGEMGFEAWYGTDTVGGTNWTLELNYTDSLDWGYICYVFRDSDGFGGDNMSQGSGVHDVQLTTAHTDSAVVVYRAEYGGSYTSETWLTVNSITPTIGNSLIRLQDSGSADLVMSAYYSDVGTAGLNTYGITSSSFNRDIVVALEIRGTAGAAAIAAPWITA